MPTQLVLTTQRPESDSCSVSLLDKPRQPGSGPATFGRPLSGLGPALQWGLIPAAFFFPGLHPGQSNILGLKITTTMVSLDPQGCPFFLKSSCIHLLHRSPDHLLFLLLHSFFHSEAFPEAKSLLSASLHYQGALRHSTCHISMRT